MPQGGSPHKFHNFMEIMYSTITLSQPLRAPTQHHVYNMLQMYIILIEILQGSFFDDKLRYCIVVLMVNLIMARGEFEKPL